MADPIGIASGLLALAVFAFQSSTQLYQLVESFQNNQRVVRELKEELEALNGVLRSLQETAASTDADLTSLKLPLLRCGNACRDFEAVILKCTAHSSGSKTSFRDWARLKYMGDDIVGFKTMLTGYKSTISIALGDANMRTAAITVTVLKEYKQLITNTTSDLEEHLEEINNKLQTISLQSAGISNEDAAEREQILEERDSTQQCLDICTHVLTQIDKVQPNAFINISAPYQAPVTTLSSLTSAQLVTSNTFKACRERFTDTTTQLERQLQDINNRLQKFSSQPLNMSTEQAAEQERMKEQRDCIKQSLDICNQASRQANQERTNVFEDISMADNGNQVLVSTVGDLITARRVTVGSGSLQLFGQMNDDSLQQLSRDLGASGTEKAMEPQTRIDPAYENRAQPQLEGIAILHSSCLFQTLEIRGAVEWYLSSCPEPLPSPQPCSLTSPLLPEIDLTFLKLFNRQQILDSVTTEVFMSEALCRPRDKREDMVLLPLYKWQLNDHFIFCDVFENRTDPLALLTTCRQVYREWIDVLYSRCVFYFEHFLTVIDLARTVLPQCINPIRALDFLITPAARIQEQFDALMSEKTGDSATTMQKAFKIIAGMEFLRILHIFFNDIPNLKDGERILTSEERSRMIIQTLPLRMVRRTTRFEIEVRPWWREAEGIEALLEDALYSVVFD
ncbi:hypothetical protein G7Y89_g14671 [Cudoniella acicularis]|uniref:Fungal N-terminal domain-containing protein n=1 Tax=Cudoniella acicularis TaxID=354080 RepID=A0A8H4QYY0_9HELO|nr:hypothetical protein G7Y89_g14671 [Cudoniella acicularis]